MIRTCTLLALLLCALSALPAASQTPQADQFLNEITNALPNWETIDTSEGYQEWLGQKDPVTKLTRYILMEDAVTRYDSEDMLALFDDFLEEFAIAMRAAIPDMDTLTKDPAWKNWAEENRERLQQAVHTYKAANVAQIIDEWRRKPHPRPLTPAERERNFGLTILLLAGLGIFAGCLIIVLWTKPAAKPAPAAAPAPVPAPATGTATVSPPEATSAANDIARIQRNPFMSPAEKTTLVNNRLQRHVTPAPAPPSVPPPVPPPVPNFNQETICPFCHADTP